MINFRNEADLWRRHRIVFRQKEFELEEATFEGRILGSCHDHMEVASVRFVGNGADAYKEPSKVVVLEPLTVRKVLDPHEESLPTHLELALASISASP